MLKSLTGTIESLVYRNPNNNYTVFYMQVDDELVTAVGRVPIVWPGEVVTVEGDWSFHAEYGKQFDFLSCERRLPDEMEGMVQYLSSGCFKGVEKSGCISCHFPLFKEGRIASALSSKACFFTSSSKTLSSRSPFTETSRMAATAL